MIPKVIVEALNSLNGEIERSENEKDDVTRNIPLLGLEDNSEFSEFFMSYNLCGVVSERSIELLDLCFPSDEIFETTEWARDIYELNGAFICLSSGEGEGFILLSKINGEIYDVSVGDFSDLAEGKLSSKWASFYELINWYLSVAL